jgi:site-specific recombinase XerD
MARLKDTNTNPLFQPFLDSMFVVSHSEKTVKTYKSGLRNLERFTLQKYQCDLSKVISKIKAGELDIYRVLKEYVIHLDKAGKSPASIKTWTASAKEFFRYYEIKIYSEDFKQIIKMPKKTHYREEPMTKEIILRLLRNLPSRLQVLILVAISSGMRIGEMMHLKISDIDFNSNPTKVRI